MAIHATVFYTPDKKYRITGSERGDVFTVERDLVFEARFTVTHKLVTWLNEHGYDLADLVID